MGNLKELTKGLLKENPIFVQFLGMCATLAVTTSVINGIGMGLSTTVVLVASNIIISLLRSFIPNKVRIAAYIIVIAGCVTAVEMVLKCVCTIYIKITGYFYSAHCGKLHYSGSRRGICFEKQRGQICVGRNRHGLGIYAGAGDFKLLP